MLSVEHFPRPTALSVTTFVTKATFFSTRSRRNHHVNDHGNRSQEDDHADRGDHLRVGLNFTAPNAAVNDMVTPGRKQCDQRTGANHAFAERRRELGPVHRHLWIHVHRDFAHPETEPRDYKSQAHHCNARPNPSEKRAFVGENLRFDLIGIELPFFMPGIAFRLVRLGHS